MGTAYSRRRGGGLNSGPSPGEIPAGQLLPDRPDEKSKTPITIVLTAVAFACVAGAFEVLNTSIGWHLAAGRWMLQHGEVIRFNPFTLTAEMAPWLDHEWLFQIIAAAADAAAGVHALVLLRVICVTGIALILLRISRQAGLAPAPALLLVAFCIVGARFRFYVRPELATLLLTPLGVHCYLTRASRSLLWSALAIAVTCILGINLHAGILVLPVILGVLLAAEIVREGFARRNPRAIFVSGAALLAAAAAGLIVNPWGYEVFAAPVRLAHLVSQDFIPNPEWISPGPGDVPELYVGIVLVGVILAWRERDLVRWALFFIAAALALRYVRNVGLFFVLLPDAVASALAGFSALRTSRKRVTQVCMATCGVLAALMIDAGGFPLGFGYSAGRYPIIACEFAEKNNLLSRPLYNDVRFGGWLIGKYYPPNRAFIDDRNEIHEEVLAEMWDIEQNSSVARWQNLLDQYDVAAALLRYHDPLRVRTPDGEDLGFRGYSALWFPSRRWAVVHWDDVAIILANREKANPQWVADHEYHWLRPDDLEYLEKISRSDPEARRGIESELARKLREDPGCSRAAALANRILE